MHPLRSVSILSSAIPALLSPIACQAAQQLPAKPPAPIDARTQGLPPFLVAVPGGTVQMGLTAKDIVRVACEAVSPTKPQSATLTSPTKVEEALMRTARTLGQKRVPVEAFVLGKWLVKNSEYEVFVKQMRAQGKKVRAPLHWWRDGCKDDYEKRLPDINRQFPKDPLGPVKFWEQNGHELPYQLLDADGKSIADKPVAFVTYGDALAFAGWLGMRLPTEVEWTRAARGDGTNLWPWGSTALGDTYAGDPMLKHLRLHASADRKSLPAGTIETATGPYGHVDMYGRIWQLVSTSGYAALNGQPAFSDEWKLLLKDKVAAVLKTPTPPAWNDLKVLAKGGSYFSGSEPVQLLLDARMSLQVDDLTEGTGLRVAKSLQPGYDVLYSLVRTAYNRAAFALEQNIDLTAQVGTERYELGTDGFPTAYHAVSFAPVNWLSNEKGAELGKLLDRSQHTAMLVGTLALTENLVNPAVPAALYSVLYRDEGMAKELSEAIKVGYKEVQAELKKAKAGEPKPEEGAADEGAKKKGEWRDVLKKYGLLPADLEPKEAANGLDFVRIDGIDVSTKQACYLLLGNEGKVVAVIPATKNRPAVGKAFPSALVFEAGADGKSLATFRFCVPVQSQDPKKAAEFQLSLNVDTAPPTAAVPWRLPGAAAPARAPAAAANSVQKEAGKDTGETSVGGTNGDAKPEPKPK